MRNTRIDSIISNSNLLSAAQLEAGLRDCQTENLSLYELALSRGWAKESDLLSVMGETFKLPVVHLTPDLLSETAARVVPAKIAYRHAVVPLNLENGILTLAICDPFNVQAIDDVRLVSECDVHPVLCSEQDIVKALKVVYGVGADTVDHLMMNDPGLAVSKNTADAAGGVEHGDTTIISFVNQIIRDAYHDRATDIHIEPFEDNLIIRYRIDGVLHEVPTPGNIKGLQASIVSCIKIMAEMDIAEKRLPQDGRILFRYEREMIDLRVSTLPVIHGESIDLRILPRTQMHLGLEKLGLPNDNLLQMELLIRRPHGIVLVTGPTGNGKTTTLYGCLSKLNSPDKKIITVEDPVEYQLKGINQVPVNAKIGLTFANGLRSILRQDPDIIMVGEIRDYETAEIAIRSSLTGHLVFSTLHTNDAPGALTRLIDMGIEPYLVSSSIEAILAQRLIRCLCPKCKEQYIPDAGQLLLMGISAVTPGTIYRSGRGCEECRHTGYKGRTGIYEMLLMDDDIRRLSMEKTSSGHIKREALKKGMRTLREDGWLKVRAGVTSIDEIVRVTQEEGQ